MKGKYLKYGILSLLGFLTVKRYIHFGDYCSGMPDGLLWLFFCIIFIITSLIIIGIDIYKKKLDYKIFILILIFILSNLFLFNSNLKEFESKETILIGSVNNFYNDKSLILNKNQSFIIEMRENHWSCYKKGNYRIKDSILTLVKDSLIEETDNIFTYKYKIDLKNKVLIPVEKGFDTITIKSSNLQILK